MYTTINDNEHNYKGQRIQLEQRLYKQYTCFQAATTDLGSLSLMPACIFISVGNGVKFSCYEYNSLIECMGVL